jgi:ABC-type sugar transport system permease subunit
MDAISRQTEQAPAPPQRSGPRADLSFRILNAPAVLLVLAFSVLPIAYVAYLSFQDLRLGGSAGGFAGWDNYRFVLADPSVARAFGNTLYFATLSVGIATLAGLGIALLLNSNLRGSGWLVLGTVLPWAIPEIVNALMWQWIYNPTYGALSGVLVSFGFLKDYAAWLSTPVSAMHALIFAYSWKLVPFVVIILYAGLQSIPDELYESAQIDGAGDWAQFRHVTLPLLAPAVAVAVLFCVVWSMRAFDIVYLLTRGGPGEGTVVLSYLVFTKAFEFGDLGAASAVACLLAVLTFAITCIYMRVLPKGDEGR